MYNKKLKLPIIIIAIGLAVAIISSLIISIMKEPVIKEQEFDYSVTYKLDGEVKTYEGGFRCSFIGYDTYDDPTLRLYDGVHTKNGETLDTFYFTIAEKEGVELSIVIDLDAAYMMGDPDKYEYVHGNDDPYLEALDSNGCSVEVSEVFDAEIVSWEYPEPIENSFAFAGITRLHAVSMLVMILVSILTLIACIIFVKKGIDVQYKALDIVSVVLNFIISFAVIPFISIVVILFPLTMDASSFIYQIYLCIPALSIFAIAASIALRRKGFTKAGFFTQLAFPVLFFVEVYVEALIYNIFF
jgi:hypothetical protein